MKLVVFVLGVGRGFVCVRSRLLFVLFSVGVQETLMSWDVVLETFVRVDVGLCGYFFVVVGGVNQIAIK